MKKTKAIPVKLLKENLTENERQLLKKYGEQPLTADEIDQLEKDDLDHKDKILEQGMADKRKAILKDLEEIDRKSIRAMRSNDAERLKQLEDQAVELRKQLV